jgi:hypothetical protein
VNNSLFNIAFFIYNQRVFILLLISLDMKSGFHHIQQRKRVIAKKSFHPYPSKKRYVAILDNIVLSLAFIAPFFELPQLFEIYSKKAAENVSLIT